MVCSRSSAHCFSDALIVVLEAVLSGVAGLFDLELIVYIV